MAQKSERNSEGFPFRGGMNRKFRLFRVPRNNSFFSRKMATLGGGVGYEEGRGLPAVHTVLQLSEFIGLQHKLQ
jgi:hypothetical protein